ncbi:DUF572-domain-containing protein [Patellaria atrata CBS 101060]|uniref:DUF572-domain-containing protein n=1 Tax=Patellaria atrata CBS 101060 TaxID=1346257 RepID=A0A9P4VPR5_9PEZI|nr:DUF572-domain-containing protein [Patellaria atrata CBS 101060]
MQGFNMGRYHPPSSLDPSLSNSSTSPRFNQNKHPLGSRAKNISKGILIVRFEMPFAIWCNTCESRSGKPTIIGQGVRFNAEKQKVGMYHTTPVFSFKMKHGACGGVIEIRAEPKLRDYVVSEGARRRDYGAPQDGEFGGKLLSKEEKERRREDAFAALEGKKEDKTQQKVEKKRVQELYEVNERDWADPYEASKRVRKGFRVEQKELKAKAKVAERIQDKFGLGMEIVEEIEDDVRRAGLIDFGVGEASIAGGKATMKPLFDIQSRESSLQTDNKVKGRTKKEVEAERSRITLQQQLKDNTMAVLNPFSPDNTTATSPNTRSLRIIGLKKKQTESNITQRNSGISDIKPPEVMNSAIGLVDYESD